MVSGSNLERLLAEGKFVVCGEMSPPQGADKGPILKKCDYFRGVVDAVNLTDNQTAIVRMSSVMSSVFLREGGLEPIMQMTCRDRNRLAQQSEVLSAAAAGVKSGDVITGVDGETVADPHDLARRIAALGPKKTVKLSIIRNGSPMTLDVTLGTMPADKTASAETRNSDDNGGSSALAKLGLTLRAAHGQDGVVVAEVDPDGAAADKGLKQGDVILEVAGKPVNRPSEVVAAIDAAKSDGKKSVLVRVKSNDGERYLTLPARAS